MFVLEKKYNFILILFLKEKICSCNMQKYCEAFFIFNEIKSPDTF